MQKFIQNQEKNSLKKDVRAQEDLCRKLLVTAPSIVSLNVVVRKFGDAKANYTCYVTLNGIDYLMCWCLQ